MRARPLDDSGRTVCRAHLWCPAQAGLITLLGMAIAAGSESLEDKLAQIAEEAEGAANR